ncbi:hypothetical protein [Collimonas arenae]|nr:hypothetical protein [Collimonas arenae]
MLFQLVQVLATPAAIAYLNGHDTSPLDLLHRHVSGDWGDLSTGDKEMNETAVRAGERILSAYVVADEKIYVITEWDRRYTTVMLASEY